MQSRTLDDRAARDPRAGPSGRAIAQDDTATPLPLLTRIAHIRALSQDGGARGYRVHIQGTVTHFDQVGGNSLVLHDGEFGQFVMPPANVRAVGAWADLEPGDSVEIEGYTVRGGFAPNVQPEKVRKLGRAALPRARSIPSSAMLTGRYDCDYVEIAGVVQRAWRSSNPSGTRLMFADVATEDGVVRAMFWDYSAEDLNRFIQRRLAARQCRHNLRAERAAPGVSLFAGRIREMAGLDWYRFRFRCRCDPAAKSSTIRRPARSTGAFGCGESSRRIPGRPVEVSDFTTTATFRYELNVLYIKDGTGGIRVETGAAPAGPPRGVIEAPGFPGCPASQSGARCSRCGRAGPPPPDGLRSQCPDARARRGARAHGKVSC